MDIQDVYTDTVQHSGLICVSAMIDGYRVSRQYDGYTKDEAVLTFIDEMKTENKGEIL